MKLQYRLLTGVIMFFLAISFSLSAQSEAFRAVFYNVENLFDCEADSVFNDKEFLPTAQRRWDMQKYQKKQDGIARILKDIGQKKMPSLIGLCEIENEHVLSALIQHKDLKRFEYNFIHYNSSDARGIDVALLYQPREFLPIKSEAIPVKFSNPDKKSRDILYTSGKLMQGDTLHVFICHFPSRSEGIKKTEPFRIEAAATLKFMTDSILQITPSANILIMGDFNDYPENRSILHTLKAQPPGRLIHSNELYNLTYQLDKAGEGTYKYRGKWCMPDQIIVSGNLLNTKSRLHTANENIQIFKADYLFEDDEKYGGKKPFRTYIWINYHGGYSDHLPLVVDFKLDIRVKSQESRQYEI